ncbi:NERD domain-containing protein [Aquibacillus halophilus]|uniref:NERD domain-containing protein n=1 Tax=Aquibacillus halophilus TaxID=930132 RepID=A0A6A8D6R7_9BACI|nr:nuclease-related domain-containing protein [Aquibacillus halophilus]MRH41278.1 NERD domain-containing protein [Aquibacillus halophilus]
MIIKNRKVPMIIELEQAVLRRLLPPDHPKRTLIKNDLAKWESGFMGEESLNYYVDRLPQKHLHIFNDLRLKNGMYHFQNDCLLLTPHFTLIIEVKNYSGTLYFDTISKQFIRTIGGREDSFDDPIIQVEEQQEQLLDWLMTRNITSLPVDFIIGIINPKTIVEAHPDSQHIFQFILHLPHIKNEFLEVKSNYNEECLTLRELSEISGQLVRSHSPKVPDIHTPFGLKRSDFQRGVQCPNCLFLGMNRENRKWHCPRCYTVSKTAHLQAIDDYLLLINPSITNQQCKELLLLKDRHISYKLLSRSGLPFSGTNRGRVYYRAD